jgi:hypothetical protein
MSYLTLAQNLLVLASESILRGGCHEFVSAKHGLTRSLSSFVSIDEKRGARGSFLFGRRHTTGESERDVLFRYFHLHSSNYSLFLLRCWYCTRVLLAFCFGVIVCSVSVLGHFTRSSVAVLSLQIISSRDLGQSCEGYG